MLKKEKKKEERRKKKINNIKLWRKLNFGKIKKIFGNVDLNWKKINNICNNSRYIYCNNGYDTYILTNGGSDGAIFDDSYKVYLSDESYGTVDIKFVEQGLNDWVVHAIFKKAGNTEVILESPSGEKTVFDIKVDRNTYTINKK